jgi:hypothetical protein
MPLQMFHMCMLVHVNGRVTLKGAHILTEFVKSNELYRTSDYCDFYKDRTTTVIKSQYESYSTKSINLYFIVLYWEISIVNHFLNPYVMLCYVMSLYKVHK